MASNENFTKQVYHKQSISGLWFNKAFFSNNIYVHDLYVTSSNFYTDP